MGWQLDPQHPVAAGPATNRGRIVSIDHNAGYNSTLFINGQQITVSRGFKKSYRSDGSRWNEGAPTDLAADRKPAAFGVPVTTLVGYYDPQGQLPSYLYPALHGAYGFAYGDDGERLGSSDCQLQVETRDGLLRFAGQSPAERQRDEQVPRQRAEREEPRSASVLCRNQSQAEAQLAPAPAGLGYTVNGMPLAAR